MRFVTALTLLALAAPVAAQEAPVYSGQASAPAKAKKSKNDPDKVICRSVASTGSLIVGRSECHTRAEWEQLTRETREALRGRGATVPAPPIRPGGGG
ncbi:biopolymer transport protein ExbD [Sphingomonas kyeonggiensis]|uniref:hypothetical protein n=1 Tax=Sphingomonas kyeonggiensis TaxID=1268553 RepID=UPI0027827C7C|nr:hypothetical protein [Sphingomonas kyeonggiensis]MDQ0249315.1 biopolymer transport protein ExbD [Sphingomonas kyeonggiensis]